MHEQPLVSIIIPTYNRAHLIGETLDSVLAQTYTNWECIVVDDVSTDATDEVLVEYVAKDSRFQYHHRPKDRPKGANACRNYGFELSKGEYVNWFDSDDLMLPDKIRKQLSCLIDSNFDFSVCQTLIYDRNQDKVLGLRKENIRSNNAFEDYILFNIFWTTIAPLWRKTFLEENRFVFDESLQQSQEYDFHVGVLASSVNYYVIDEPLNYLVDHLDNMSKPKNSSKPKVWSNMKVRAKILKAYHPRLSKKTKHTVFNQMLTIYCDHHTRFGYQLFFRNFKQTLNSMEYLKLNMVNKIEFQALLILSFLSFLFFGKGYLFTKPLRKRFIY
ncbi:MAG TPA: hypothetical protein DIV44_14385 [Leeuwenhoekiella sp.]|nr:hypothetical protein [Leeuwenhoekiella sp.]HBO28516.1 hypothetical protein [Leeuwenhoekiella sp.]HCQ77992.1 hypothetical protein [Leeuwenhoekiella sp.]|tara:strand:+ start:10429 stop:11415 length:987 start_codon:yes stop_codon:yes gene_type:complete